jgi:hypothetical protein
MNDILHSIEKSVEILTGMKSSDIRNKTIDKIRFDLEANKTKIRFISEFPFIGRGSVLRDFVLEHDIINSDLDKALK